MHNDARPLAKIYPRDCILKNIYDIAGKKVTVMGLGLNGGGEASARFFLQHGAFVTVTDTKSEEELSKSVLSLQNDKALDVSRLRFVLGAHNKEDFLHADIIIKNPIVKYETNEFLQCADFGGKSIETDISIFLHFTKARIIAVSGSKGKSTTASAIHYGLTQAGFKSFLGGNITVSPLTFLDQTDSGSIVVLEMSSWQLRDLRGRGVLKPEIAVMTKIVSDHQNWYGNMQDYVADKKLLYADQDAHDALIIGDDSVYADVFAKEATSRVVFTDSNILCGKKMLLPGAHNLQNIANAAEVLHILGVPPEKCASLFAAWSGIPHRTEYFFTYKNKKGAEIPFYNDSASTVPDSTIASIKSFDGNMRLIAGGTDKDLDFTALAEILLDSPPYALYLLAGSGTDKLLDAMRKKAPDHAKIFAKNTYTCLNFLLNDVKSDLEQSGKAYPVVFSPGATSFGMFKNEFDRGNKFKEGVLSIYGND